MIKGIPTKDWISPKVAVKQTKNKGKGMFALENIKAGELVMEWGGNYVTKKELDKFPLTNEMVMQWDEDVYSIEGRGETLGYYINHSCNGNVWMEGVNKLVARVDINKNEEITADYALWEFRHNYVSKWECSCKSIDCRGRVTGEDWKLPHIQEKYKDHFSPLINKMIKASKS